MIRPGQICAAVGCMTSKAGLTLENYNTSLVKPQPKEMSNFYDSMTILIYRNASKKLNNTYHSRHNLNRWVLIVESQMQKI